MNLYDNSRTVANENQILSDFQNRSLDCYQHYTHQKNLKYAAHPRSCFDLFRVENPKKTLVFIHGGYWQWCDKSDFAFIAPDVLAQQCDCVLLEYDLAPHSTLSNIVEQIQKALDFIQQQTWCTEHVVLVGHSAGAHLAAQHLGHEMVSSAVLISGIYDLTPIQNTHLNQALRLSQKEIYNYSPLQQQHAFHKPYSIIYGALELDELKWQSQHYFQHRQKIEPDQVSLLVCKDENHYSILQHYFKDIFKA